KAPLVSLIAVPAVEVWSQPPAGISTGVSRRCCFTVSGASDLSRLAAGYARALDIVVALSKTMYSYDGPVMVEPSGYLATGTVMLRLLLSGVAGGAEMSQPFQARL